MRSVVCPINPRTKEKFECSDCPYKNTCIEDILDDARQESMRAYARADKKIGKLLKERRGK